MEGGAEGELVSRGAGLGWEERGEPGSSGHAGLVVCWHLCLLFT